MTKTIALDIGGTKILALLFNENSKEIARLEVPTLASQGGAKVLEQIYLCIDNFITQHDDIKNIGISIAGIIDSVNGIIVKITAIQDWQNFKLKEVVSNHYHNKFSLAIENDANCALMGEYAHIKNKSSNINNISNISNIIMLTLGTGLGGAIVINNQLFTGDNFSAGEFSLTSTSTPLGEKVLNDVLSGPGLTAIVNHNSHKNFNDAKEIMIAHKQNDKLAIQGLEIWLDLLAKQIHKIYLSLGIINYILGGGLINSSDIWWDKLTDIVTKYDKNIIIHKAELNNDAGAYGARELFK